MDTENKSLGFFAGIEFKQFFPGKRPVDAKPFTSLAKSSGKDQSCYIDGYTDGSGNIFIERVFTV